MMHTIFHADLSDAHPGEEYWLHACGRRYPLVPHTDETRAKVRASSNGYLAALSNARLTHFTESAVKLPHDRVVRVHVKHTMKGFPNARGKTGASHCAIHIPPAGAATGAHADEASAFATTIDYLSSAKAFLFHHADLINVDPGLTRRIYEYMDGVQSIRTEIGQLVQAMRQMGPPAEESGWARLTPFTPPVSDLKGCDGKTTYYMQQPTEHILSAAAPAMSAMLNVTKNDLELGGIGQGAKLRKWTLQQGTSVTTPVTREMDVVGTMALEDGAWRVSLANEGTVSGLSASVSVVDAGKQTLTLTMHNSYIRYLGAYVRFLSASGEPLSVPDWTPDEPDAAYGVLTAFRSPEGGAAIQYDDLRFLGIIEPINNFMAIPIASDPGELKVRITFPKDAASAVLYGSGLGTGADPYPMTPLVGGMLTGLLNLGVPAFMLAFGAAAQSYKPLYDIVKRLSENKLFVGAVLGAAAGYFGYKFGTAAQNKEMDWKAFSTLSQLLFNQGTSRLLAWVEADIAVEAAADEIPFAGWIVFAMNVCTGLAQMAETIVEVATSPWNIENRMALTVATSVTLHPDPRQRVFPPPRAGQPARYEVKMIFQDQNRPTVSLAGTVPADAPSTLRVTFPDNTLGGRVKLEADYYIGSWLAGKATTGFVDNIAANTTSVDLYLVDLPVPLTSDSVYEHSSLLTYSDGCYAWTATNAAPTATVTSTDASNRGNAISVWSGLTLSQRTGMLGTAWRAAGMGIRSGTTGQPGQLFAMQNTPAPGEAMGAVLFPENGFDAPTLLVYDPYPPRFLMDANRNWQVDPKTGQPVPDPDDQRLGDYYVDPRKANRDPSVDGGYHLRSVALSPPKRFDLQPEQPSYGRMPYAPDSICLHPSGHYVAVNAQYAKIMIGSLVLGGTSDGDLPLARVYAGKAKDPKRPGLLFHPVAVTCANDGTILILEDTRSAGDNDQVVLSRIQAFDLNGNPVNRFFDSRGAPSSFLDLLSSGTSTHLDIAAVGDQTVTYVYVLHYTGSGASASDYGLSIYQIGKTAAETRFLVRTPKVAAAKIAVDMWHTAYTLNYDMVTDGRGNHAGPESSDPGSVGRTVPSISVWLPPAPKS